MLGMSSGGNIRYLQTGKVFDWFLGVEFNNNLDWG